MIITNIEELKLELTAAINNIKVAMDTETVSLEDKTVVGFSFAYEVSNIIRAFYVPLNHKYIRNADKTKVKSLLKQLFSSKRAEIIFHNASFDMEVFQKFGTPIPDTASVHDTMILAHLVDENRRIGLKQLALELCHHRMLTFKEVCGTGKSQISFSELTDLEIIDKYASSDAYFTLRLFNKLYPQVFDNSGTNFIYHNIEQPLLHAVTDMQSHGITIDIAKVTELGNMCRNKVEMSKAQVECIMGDINLNSPKQMREWFIGIRHLKPLKLSSRTNEPSIDKEFLEHYREEERCPEINMILTYRKYNKLLSTFIPALTPQNGQKIYAKFRQNGTVSGRFSSAQPNMQNIPRDKDDFDIREAVIADKDEVLIGADYSQIELRLTAHFSQDKRMLEAYKTNSDIHQLTANACGCSRQHAKTINFGLIYGMGINTLARQLSINEIEAARYYEKYWKQYPEVQKFMQKAEERALKEGGVKTKFGRCRHLRSDFESLESWKQNGVLRSMFNAIIQGSAADIMKLAMVKMYPQLRKIGARMILCVHDEVLVTCPKDKLAEGFKIVESSMLKAGKGFSVPILIDIKCGFTWAQVHGDKGYTVKELQNVLSGKKENKK